ncbi:AI-2E family transporter [Halobacillus locisalis]|uniref:AI-2E family transporter n=1 Tax=Halobacillus locisalis TaxID=220753 RepID=A0A838CTF4_9BACI|nr:AI-2E family transporter [Halobacillus locisalis]MBA2174896.1 AI-2E family transporter [Halobacillus locisalis]
MWWKHPYFKYITASILFLIFVFFMRELHMISPFLTVFRTLFYPILITGFLFYITRPIVEWLSTKFSIPLVGSISIVYAVLAGLIFLAGRQLFSTIKQQVEDISHLPTQLQKMADKARQEVEKNDMGMLSTHSLEREVTQYFSDLGQRIGTHLTEVFSTVVGAATVLLIIPLLLFFFLKDGRKLVPFLTRAVPGKYREEAVHLLGKLDRTLAAYIVGQMTVAAVDGVLMYISYLIIGLDYALLLGLFVVVTAIIPFFGPIIGVIPAAVVALTQDPMLVIYVLIALIVVQQLEGNLVAPLVLGQRLEVHPMTIILLLVIAAPLAGFIGMVIVIPLYSVGKVLVKAFYRFLQLSKGKSGEQVP